MTARINGYVIRSKKDVQDFVSELDELAVKTWGRRLSTSALTFLYSQFEPFLKTESEAPLTPEEMLSGKSIAEILKERKERLAVVWKERKKEAFLRSC